MNHRTKLQVEFEEKFLGGLQIREVNKWCNDFPFKSDLIKIWDWVDKNFIPNEKLLGKNMHERVVSDDLGGRYSQSLLNEWDIVGMNHYYVDGKKYLFVAMQKDGKLIKEEGEEDKYFWNRLWHKASTNSR